MPINYSAWGAPATFGNALMEGLKERQQMEALKAQKMQQQDIADTLEMQRLASVPTPEAKQRIQFLGESLNARHATQPDQPQKPFAGIIPTLGNAAKGIGNFIMGPDKPIETDQVESQVNQMGPTDQELKSPIGGVGSLKNHQGPSMSDSGMSLKDESELNRQKALQQAKPAKTDYAQGRGYAMLDKVVADPTAKRRLFSVEPALQIHNALVDLYNAYHTGDTMQARTLADTLYNQVASAAARHDTAAPYFQSNMPSRDNIPAIYEAARRLAASEQNKLVSGSQAAPSDIAREEFAGNYPTLADLPQVAQGKFDRITHTMILPAITGLRGIVQPYKAWKSNPQIPLIAQDYENMLNGLEKQVTSRVKNVQGYASGNEQSVMPQPAELTGPKVLAVREKGAQ